jgi:hypothetical protein
MIFGEKCKVWSCSLCSFLHSPLTSFILGPNILISTLFSKTFSPLSSLSVRGQVSHPCKTRQNNSSVYPNFYIFREKTVRFCTEWQQAFPDYIQFLISSWMEFWSVSVFPKYLNRSTFSKDLLAVFML